MKIPKCPMTVTGNHDWQTEKFGVTKLLDLRGSHVEYGRYKITPFCVNCGLIDDRKK